MRTAKEAAKNNVEKMYEKKDVEGLIKALKDKEMRSDAADKLGKLGDPRAIDPLIKFLEENNIYGTISAAIALGELKAKEAVGPLTIIYINCLQFERKEIDRRSATYYDDIHLKEIGADTREIVIRAIGNIGDKKGLHLIERAMKDDPNEIVRKAAKTAYSKFDKIGSLDFSNKNSEIFNKLLNDLKNEDTSIATDAAEKIGKLHDNRAIQPLIDAYNRSCKHADFLGITAAEALYELGSQNGVDFLLEMVCEASPINRMALTFILDNCVGDTRFGPGLQKISMDEKRMDFLRSCNLEAALNKAILFCRMKKVKQ
jgi:HEAT repeat protein